MKEYLDAYLDTWKHVVHANLKYKRPNLVNANMKLCFTDDVPLYVFATFMKVGRQYYNVQVKHKDKPSTNYVHRCVAKFRYEDIVPFKKSEKSKVIERVFNKETSVFGKWK